jgi:hypothetical protein
MLLVIKYENGREVGIDSDGTRHADLNQTELFTSAKTAEAVAKAHGGMVADESRIFGDADLADEDYD